MANPDLEIRRARPKSKPYKLYFGNNLSLMVNPSGSKVFRVRYYWPVGGTLKERSHTVGRYPQVTLRDAQAAAEDVRQQVADGINPAAQKKLAKAYKITEQGTTFGDLAENWLTYKARSWAASTAEKRREFVKRDLKELLELPAADITTPMVVSLLRRIELRSPETAARCRGIIEYTYQHAAHNGLVEHNPGALARGCLLPQRGGHRPAILDPVEFGQFLVDISEIECGVPNQVALAISPHLFQRPVDVRELRWSDLSLEGDEPVWIYTVRKTGKRHRLPLSPFVVGQLLTLREVTGVLEYCFPAPRNLRQPISDNTLGKLVREAGYQGRQSLHGLRSTARTLLDEQLHFPVYLIARAMTHDVANLDRLKGAYDRTNYDDERRKMMNAWSEYLLRLEADARARRDGKNVVLLNTNTK